MRGRRVLVAGDDVSGADSRFRGSILEAVFCFGCWRLSAGAATKGRGVHKIWLGVVVLAVEAVVLAWLVGGHVLQCLSSGLAGR